MDKSKERAYQIIAHHLESIKKTYGIVKSVVLVGSLSDDTYTGNMQTAANPPVRLISQSVLTGAMTHYYFGTGKNCSSKAKIYEKINKEMPNYRFLRLDEKVYMINEYQTWYKLTTSKPYEYVPLSLSLY